MSHLLLLNFLFGFFSLPAPTVTRREINNIPYNPSQDGFLVRRVSGCYPSFFNMFSFRCFVLSLLFTYVR